MESVTLKSVVIGFIAGAIAVVTVHELIDYALLQAGYFPRVPWSTTPAAVTQIPQIASDILWGGLWGAVFALILGNKPHGSMTLRGALLGILGPALVGVFILVPLITGRFPMFFDGDQNMIGSVLLIAAGFGAATAWLYGLMSYGRLP